MTRFVSLLARLVIVSIVGVVSSVAARAESLSPNLIQLSSRVFDLRTDVSTLRRNSRFVPVTRVKWLADYLARDPAMYQSVFHIRSQAQPVTHFWQFGHPHVHAEGIPVALQIEGYEIRTSHPTTHAGRYYLPRIPEPDHSIACGPAGLCVVRAK